MHLHRALGHVSGEITYYVAAPGTVDAVVDRLCICSLGHDISVLKVGWFAEMVRRSVGGGYWRGFIKNFCERGSLSAG